MRVTLLAPSYCIEHQAITTPNKVNAHTWIRHKRTRCLSKTTHVVYSEGEMAHEVTLRLHPHNALNANQWHSQILSLSLTYTHIHSNQYKRTRCSFRTNTTPSPYIQQTNEDQRTTIINIVVLYSERKMAHWVKSHYGLILLHQTPISASNKVNRARINSCNTNVRAVRPQPIWHPFNTFNEWR